MAQFTQQTARQRGLASTQVAAEPDKQPRPQVPRQARAQGLSGGIIGQLLDVGAVIITAMDQDRTPATLDKMKPLIRQWGRQLGLDALGFAPVDLGNAKAELMDWLAQGYHGDMDYMARHVAARTQPATLVPGTIGIISARMDYFPATAADPRENLDDAGRAYVSRYALGRDYHKLMRARLQQLGRRIAAEIGPFQSRPFADSAPVMEVALASRASLGWRGKHSLLLSRAGSWFFLGELFTDLPFSPDTPDLGHCGNCQACIDLCPTGAIVAPYRVDARRCISYLTIEHPGAIPVELRPLLGNRIYGCDDCQLACPWNRFAQSSTEVDFLPRNGLDAASLIELFSWSEAQFLARFAGSAIRRIGHERWLRNLAVALGNAPHGALVVAALQSRLDHPSALLREHLQWALSRQAEKHEHIT